MANLYVHVMYKNVQNVSKKDFGQLRTISGPEKQAFKSHLCHLVLFKILFV